MLARLYINISLELSNSIKREQFLAKNEGRVHQKVKKTRCSDEHVGT
jgi:hypothetical protein